eukprot:1183331-Prorocentrum_minimum.AAC.5
MAIAAGPYLDCVRPLDEISLRATTELQHPLAWRCTAWCTQPLVPPRGREGTTQLGGADCAGARDGMPTRQGDTHNGSWSRYAPQAARLQDSFVHAVGCTTTPVNDTG